MANWKEPKNDYKAESQVTPDIFNTLGENERYLQEKKITIEQVQDASVNSTQSTSRENLEDKETVKGFFGKIRKWISDLRTLAFKSIVGTNDIENSAINASKIATNAVETSKIKDSSVTNSKIANNAVTDAKISSVTASNVTGLHRVATSGSYNDLKDKPTISGGDNPKVVFEGNASYYTYNLGFDMKSEYRYAVEINDGIGIGISTKRTPQDEPRLNVLIPGHCYGTDAIMNIYAITIVGYEGNASYEGGGVFGVEGIFNFDNDGNVDAEGYMEIDGRSCPKIKRVIELGKAY